MRGEVEKGDAQPRRSMMLKKSAPGPRKNSICQFTPDFQGMTGLAVRFNQTRKLQPRPPRQAAKLHLFFDAISRLPRNSFCMANPTPPIASATIDTPAQLGGVGHDAGKWQRGNEGAPAGSPLGRGRPGRPAFTCAPSAGHR